MFEGVPVSRGVWYDLNEITNCYWQVEVSCVSFQNWRID